MTLAYLSNRREVHAHLRPQRSATFRGSYDLRSLSVGQLRVSVSLTARDRSVANSILPILSNRSVIKVFNSIVLRIPVSVADEQPFGSRTNERCGDKRMYRFGDRFTIYAQRHLKPSGKTNLGFEHPRLSPAPIGYLPPYPPEIANRVIRGDLNCSPLFNHETEMAGKQWFGKSRRIINGVDRAADIATYAIEFQKGLTS